MDDWRTFGLVYENLCVRDLSVYAQALPAGPAEVRYYRDDAGLEADAVIELADGRWAAFEFKLGIAKAEAGVASLKRLRKKMESANPMSRTRPPSFMAVVTGTGEYAYRADEGVYVIPIRALGA